MVTPPNKSCSSSTSCGANCGSTPLTPTQPNPCSRKQVVPTIEAISASKSGLAEITPTYPATRYVTLPLLCQVCGRTSLCPNHRSLRHLRMRAAAATLWKARSIHPSAFRKKASPLPRDASPGQGTATAPAALDSLGNRRLCRYIPRGGGPKLKDSCTKGSPALFIGPSNESLKVIPSIHPVGLYKKEYPPVIVISISADSGKAMDA